MSDAKEDSIEVGAIAPQFIDHSADEAIRAVKQGRANEVDIAALILAENLNVAGTENEWTPQEDKRLMRKVDWRLIPIVRKSKTGEKKVKLVLIASANIQKLFVCATLSGLDKTAISAAAIYNLKDDLHLSGQQYSWCGSAPFFGGLALIGPSAYLLQILPPVKYFACELRTIRTANHVAKEL